MFSETSSGSGLQQPHMGTRDILSQSTIALMMEVRPRSLVPDTNCFVDYLSDIESIARAHPLYQLMVPIVVINELEGLSKGIKPGMTTGTTTNATAAGIITSKLTSSVSVFPTAKASATTSSSTSVDRRFDPLHAEKVAAASKQALDFIRKKNPALKCVTTKGSILNTSTFTAEDGDDVQMSNDDRILKTALNLCRDHVEEKRVRVIVTLSNLSLAYVQFNTIMSWKRKIRRGPLHLPRRGAPDDGSEPTGESPVQRLTGTRATGLYQMGRAWIGVEQHQFLRPD
ncbi:AAEL005526-PA [Aedes aegypti]|uniref:AAEL005526-PA n=1 Tax=Aedes aegypti TaxID=7159 RepID=Q179R6_AEDAE|nr:AAEL005526-PA [Aedes aegypti]